MPKKKPEPDKRPPGRQTTFSQETADKICARLAEGEPLAHICRDEDMPAVRTVSGWKEAHPDFKADFARAREDGYDAIAQECLDIADATENDTIDTEHGERANTEWISRSKLRVETRLKLLAKWDPKRYGEKLAIGGASDLPPLQTLSDEDLAAKLALLMAKTNGSAEQE